MSRDTEDDKAAELVLEVDLEAAPDKVWRALSIEAFRERWLPAEDLADPEPIASVPGEELLYRMREPEYGESLVAFRIAANAAGGTRLRILHHLTDTRRVAPRAANGNAPLMRAA
ncbi:polyketide cyclase [Jiella endophytica]|uniref:Polyketide cyclase n=1 Tax=Jiella endophytica TaxID=2558362 RepID=A0A4Y8RGB4_9HYPH|nr:polyketide cyclase [Jiella endophytica]TFF21769.1 polyketide cyclase [Jiella endophytica]